MQLPIYQVDAFARRVYAGNPAAIVPLERWLPDETLQSIAEENNLSETAYFVADGDRYLLRWFTPACEVDLCGHATLASAYVIFRFLEPERESVEFQTLSGTLRVTKDEGLLTLDFPSRPPQPVAKPHPLLLEALGGSATEVLAARDYMVVYETEDEVAALKPDMTKLSEIDRFAVIVTAPGRMCDFVSRFFAPGQGVAEDPVTGSAHCTLIPYWSKRLGKQRMFARQISKRGGELRCDDEGERVKIAGEGALYLKGTIEVP